jgi:outer membrane protein assembly factor BamE (lipoprotein component of BamABCDE complex)
MTLGLGGCMMPSFMPGIMSFPPQVRGNYVDPDQVKQLVPGTTTKADVTSLLGSPTARATFDDNQWLYISQVTKPVIAGTNGVLDQQVVVVSFDDNGTVKDVQTKNKDDALPVSVVSRTTPSPGNNASFLQQLLGNVGKFSAGSGTSSSAGGGGAAGGGSGANSPGGLGGATQ